MPLYKIENLIYYYPGSHRPAMNNISLQVEEGELLLVAGGSGSGKSSLARVLAGLIPDFYGGRFGGKIFFRGKEIDKAGRQSLAREVGMVFQKPNPFPKSVFDNVAYGPRIHGVKNKEELRNIVERSLKQAALWEEVKGELKKNAINFSGGQQQRLCIARAIAVEPEVLLLDEPTSALDPIATQKIEKLIEELSEKYTIVIVTHNLQQALRISDYMMFFYMGELVEFDETNVMTTNPKDCRTSDYLRGIFS